MSMVFLCIAVFVVGLIVGLLYGRNHPAIANKVQETVDQVQKKL